MKIKLFSLLLFIVSFVHAQENTSYDNDVKHFLEINGTMGQYKAAIPQLMTMLKEQHKDDNFTEKDWEEVKLTADQSLYELSDDLTVIYKKFFTHDEIKQLNKLYETDVAQKFINNVVNLSSASQEVSIVWSRNLYNKIEDLLANKKQ